MTTITVSTMAELRSALASATGGETILLNSGNYGKLSLSSGSGFNINFPSNVTITSADPKAPAVFSAADVQGATNLTFDGITFDHVSAVGASVSGRPFSFAGCQNLTIRNSTFDGSLAQGVSPAADGYPTGVGLQVRNSDSVVVENCEFYDFFRGMVFGNDTNLVVRNNDIHSIRSDGVDFADVQNVLIEGNYIHDFRGSPTAGDHGDMIQFFTTGTKQPSTDIVIRDNVLDIGNGTWTQSIFMRNEEVDSGRQSFATMAYQNILIENNTITNSHAHGITVGGTVGLTIRNNSVLHADGGKVDGADQSVEIPKITVAGSCVNVNVTQNATAAIWGWTGQQGWTVANNALVQDQNILGPNYYGNIFTASSLVPQNGQHRYVAQVGSIIDTLNAGSAVTQGLSTLPPSTSGGTGTSGGSTTPPTTSPVTPTVPSDTQTDTGTPGTDSSTDQGSPGQLQVQLDVVETSHSTRVFDASASTFGGGALPSDAVCTWTFGDGTTAEGITVEHSFADGGAYDVSLTITLGGGEKASGSASVPVECPQVVSLDHGRFIAWDHGVAVDLGAAPKMTSDGMQLGTKGITATIDRSNVLDVVGSDDMTIAFSLDADRVGSSGELFRLPGSFWASVTRSGELQLRIMHDGSDTGTTLTTSGAKLNSVADVNRDLVVHLQDGNLQIWVDGTLRGQTSVSGVVGGATGFDTSDLYFGNPWGRTNFKGDLSAFEISVGDGDFPTAPQTAVLKPSVVADASATDTMHMTTSTYAMDTDGDYDGVQLSDDDGRFNLVSQPQGYEVTA